MDEHHLLCPHRDPDVPTQYIPCLCAPMVMCEDLLRQEIIIKVQELYAYKLDTANREPTEEEVIETIQLVTGAP